MQYQLVLQFRGDSLTDYDRMAALENQLIEELGKSAKVDGHDVGSDETNIFIFTSDPQSTFYRIKDTVKQDGRLEAVTAAYREVAGEHYTVIWPEDAPQDFKLS